MIKYDWGLLRKISISTFSCITKEEVFAMEQELRKILQLHNFHLKPLDSNLEVLGEISEESSTDNLMGMIWHKIPDNLRPSWNLNLSKKLHGKHKLPNLALDNIDEVIKIIRGSKNPTQAKEGLMNSFNLSEIQAQAILDMRLQKLTGLEVEKVVSEYKEVIKIIAHLKGILESKNQRMDIIKDELLNIQNQYM